MTATAPDIAELIHRYRTHPIVAGWLRERQGSWATFVPRPDDPANYDQQHSFCYNRDAVSFLVGGNAAGTTEAAAFKTSLLTLRQQPPPRRNTPFWIISNTLEQSCDVCWGEKLLGHKHIPSCEIDWDGVTWLDKRREWPGVVPLKPWPTDRGGNPNCNWQLCFKSFEQGRQAMQARSIGGFWFSEQFPPEIFLEVLRGCREYMFPGAQFCEFTPIDPDLSVWVEELMETPPEGFAFYRANTASNRPNLAAGWYEQFFGSVADEMKDTRQIGTLASFEGVIYPGFDRAIHVVDENEIEIPPNVYRGTATDWGASVEHPFVTVFGYRDGAGCWTIVDEYWSIDQTKITIDHANAVLDICDHWGWPVILDKAASRSGRRIASEVDPHMLPNFADPSRPGEMNAFSAYGIPTMPACNSVYDGILYIRDLLKYVEALEQPRLIISSRCKHLISELRKYRWRRGSKPGGGTTLNPAVAKPEPLKKDDDCCDGLRYLCYSGDRQGGEAPITGRSQSEGRAIRGVQLQRQAVRSLRRAERDGVFVRNGHGGNGSANGNGHSNGNGRSFFGNGYGGNGNGRH